MRRVLLLALVVAACAGCTEKQRARSFGGNARETLPAGRKLVMATWKQDNLWLLTRPAKPGETPETYEFKESSSFELVQGTVVITETK